MLPLSLVTKHASAKNQLADYFTTILPKSVFSFPQSKLDLHDCFFLRLTESRDKVKDRADDSLNKAGGVSLLLKSEEFPI